MEAFYLDASILKVIMEEKDFKDTLFRVYTKIGLRKEQFLADYFAAKSPIIVRIPDGFEIKESLKEYFEQYGANLIYMDCRIETPQSIFAKMDEAGWYGIVSSIDIDRANKTEEKVTSVLLIDHFSDLDDLRARRYIESVLKVNKDHHICGTKNIPIILTFSKEDGMDYFYRSDFNIYDERYWK